MRSTAAQIRQLYTQLQGILYFEGESAGVDCFLSSITDFNPYYSTEELKEWLAQLNTSKIFEVTHLPLAELKKWTTNEWTGDLCHESGRFFSIRGLSVTTNRGPIPKWTQPIIHQPEIGVLGLITKKINGILYFLIQAKAEPGNINTYQLSPTVQATRSNYSGVHGGKAIPYLNYFLHDNNGATLIDQLQSEQGARFFKKRNRNIIVRVADDEELDMLPGFRWMTLGQIKQFMLLDNTVNMDTHSIISSISYDPEEKTSHEDVVADDLQDCINSWPLATAPAGDTQIKLMLSSHGNSYSLHSLDELLRIIARQKFNHDLEARLIPLNEVKHWRRTTTEIVHEDAQFFAVKGVRVATNNREIATWDQPIIEQVDPGIVGFILQEIEGTLHFLVQLKGESGSMDLLEIAPTVQCITGSYQQGTEPPYVAEISSANKTDIVVDAMQSEEGGRFFREENRNIVIIANDFQTQESDNYLWMNLRQLKLLVKFNNFLNVEARSLLSIL